MITSDNIQEVIFYDDLEGENIKFINFFKEQMTKGDRWWKFKKLFLKNS